MNRKFQDRYTISINVERHIYLKVNELLPRGVYISDEINEFLKQRKIDLEKDTKLKLNETNRGPIKIYENSELKNTTNTVMEQVVELTLDIYGSKNHLVKHVQNITDSKIAWNLKRNAKLVCELADTRAKDLQRENK